MSRILISHLLKVRYDWSYPIRLSLWLKRRQCWVIECDDFGRTDYIESGDEGIDDFGFEETPASIREAETDRRSAIFQQNYEALKDGRIPYETLEDQRDPTMVAYHNNLRKPAIEDIPNRTGNRAPLGCEHMGAHEMALKFPPKPCAYKDFRLNEGFEPSWG